MKNILVIAPHPDDETLGCGGTLFRHKLKGDKIHWLIVTRLSKKSTNDIKLINISQKQIKKVAAAYNFNSYFQEKYETCSLDKVNLKSIIETFKKHIHKIKPEIIYLPYRDDAHNDHKIVFDAAIQCTKTFRNSFTRSVRVYETISETDFSHFSQFKPNLYIDISKHLEEKINTFKLYETEIQTHPSPRSEINIRSLAINRGSIAGCNFAEAFISIQEIIK